jgi:hypothetical protein
MVDRLRRKQPDPFLEWKVGIFFVGAALLLGGIFLQIDILALVAAVVLAAGLVLGIVDRVRNRPDPWAVHDDEPDSP